MKIYVSVDMEGIAGIVLREQLVQGEPLYQEARRLLTAEVNAVVDALRKSGADEIVVKDAHATGFNFLPGELHPEADYCMGATRMCARFPGLDASFDGAFLIGYHAMAGTQSAVRDHTMTSLGWQSVELNGEPIGEIGLDGYLFGRHGVPVLLVSGDDKACGEAKRWIPGVHTYETKVATGRHSAVLKAPKRIYEEMPDTVRQALANRGDVKPMSPPPSPYELRIRFMSTDQADSRSYDGVSAIRADGWTAVYRDDDLIRLLDKAF